MIFQNILIRLIIVSVMLCVSAVAQAQLERHAFVVGNSQYQGAGWNLDNPRNDAEDMAAVLTDLGYAVHKNTALFDLTRAQFDRELEAFSLKLPEESIALVYFAGHGVSSYRDNYLIPVDTVMTHVDELPEKAISVRSALATLLATNSKGFNIFFLDSCRDTPLEGQQISGLIKLNPVSNRTFIGYAANEGETASDGTDRNGTFTGILLQALRDFPGEAVDVFFRKVSGGVKEVTANQQNPIADNTISEKVCLAECVSDAGNKWWYALLGAAAVALILGGSDSGSSSSEDTFTLNLTPPNP